MLKWIGAVLICAASAGLGFCLARELKERKELLAEYARCLLMLRGEITFGAATLPESFRVIGARAKEPFHTLFAEAGRLLAACPQTSLRTVWEGEVTRRLTKIPLTSEDLECILELGSQMGHLDQNMQVTTLNFLLEQVKEREAQAQEAYVQKAKLFRCVGTMSGLLIVLLLV